MFGPLIRQYAQKVPRSTLARLANVWVPFLGSGIFIERISEDFLEVDVRMPLRWYNRNYVGTQYGGSIYSMVDPFFMMIFMENLGRGYIVWDKSASIDFLRPGRGTLSAAFRVTPEEIQSVREAVAKQGKLDIVKEINVIGEEGETVARVSKTLYVALKSARNDQKKER